MIYYITNSTKMRKLLIITSLSLTILCLLFMLAFIWTEPNDIFGKLWITS